MAISFCTKRRRMNWEVMHCSTTSWQMQRTWTLVLFLHSVRKHKEYHKVGCVEIFSIFTGQGAAELGPWAVRTSCGTDIATVACFDSSWEDTVMAHLVAWGVSWAGAIEELNSPETWYGILNGCYRHEAITMVIEAKENWSSFQWNVMLLQLGNAVEKHRQFEKVQNPNVSQIFISGLLLLNHSSIQLRIEAAKAERWQGNNDNGGCQSLRCMKVRKYIDQTDCPYSSATTRISWKLYMGDWEPRKSSYLFEKRSNKLDFCKHSGLDNRTRELQILLKIFHTFSLKSTTLLMNSNTLYGETAEVTTIYSCRHYFKENHFKALNMLSLRTCSRIASMLWKKK